MTEDQVIGMMVGCAVGDAYGAPFEFMHPNDIHTTPDGFVAGGTHDVSIGEYTDDTAMMLAIGDAYVHNNGLDIAGIVYNFKRWMQTGKFGTRDYVFDIGLTTANAIDQMTEKNPYAGKNTVNASGNGSIMRVASIIAANHMDVFRATGDAVAISLMTHGNADTIKYISAFVPEVMGYTADNRKLRAWDVRTDTGTGSIMHSYNVAMDAAHYHYNRFEFALKHALRFGYDTDTNCAVTGTLVGANVGLSGIPDKFVNNLQNAEYIIDLAKQLYQIGINNASA